MRMNLGALFPAISKSFSRVAGRRSRRGRALYLEALEIRELFTNTPPVLVNVLEAVAPGSSVSIANASFVGAFSDVDSGNTLQSIKIVTLPAHGTITLNTGTANSAITLNQIVSASALTSITYTPASGYVGNDAFRWTASDGTSLATTPASVLVTVSDLQVQGNGVLILNGDTSPLATDQTLFGVTATTGTTSKSFTVTNISNATINLDAALLKISGSDFKITGSPATTLSPNESTSITIAFTPLAIGTRSAKVTLPDPSRAGGVYTFTVQGTGVQPLLVTGNNVAISNHDTSPTAADFTNFGGSALSIADTSQTVTRTYVLANRGGTTLNLTGGSSLVAITGDASFHLVSAPAATLAPNATTSFTISFTPVAAGAHSATLTIPNSSADTPFVFRVTGTGLVTTNYQIGGSSSGLLVASTLAGSGAGARNGQILHISYTGRLLSGSVFDATVLHGNVPLAVRLDNDFADGQPFINNATGSGLNTFANFSVIKGWEYGLQGIKVGEHRTFIIPSDMGYGPTGSTGIPGDSMLIFDVVCNEIDGSPSWGVTSADTGSAVLPGSMTPSTGNGTDYGTLSTSATYLGHTFYGTNNSQVNSNGTATAQIVNLGFQITGANPRDFIAQGTYSQFVIYFKPSAPGVRTAVVHFKTNDPLHPDFAFAVKGYSKPFTDLIISSLGSRAFPSTIDNTSSVHMTVPVMIENFGNSPVPAGSTTDVQVTVTDTSSSANQPIVVGTIAHANLAGIGANLTREIDVPIVLNGTLANSTYTLGISVNSSGAINESLTNNNTGSGAMNLNAVLTSDTFTSHVLDQPKALKGSVVITVKNTGSLTFPSNETADITLIAVDSSNNETTVATLAGQSVGSLAAGSSKNITIPVNFAAGLPAGSYHFKAVVTPRPGMRESVLTDNTSTASSSGALSLVVGDPGVDLTTAFGGTALGNVLSGTANTVQSLPVIVRNQGNIITPGTTTASIQISLIDTSSANQPQLLKTVNQAIGNLPPDQSRTYNIPVTVPKGILSTGTWQYQVTVSSSVDVAAGNNTATGTFDIGGNIVSTTIGTVPHNGTVLSRNVVVRVKNLGSLTLPSNELVRVQVIAHDATNDITLNNSTLVYSVASVLAGGSKDLTIPVSFAGNLLPLSGTQSDYTLEVRITPVIPLAEANFTNNLITTGTSGAAMTIHVVAA